MSVWNTLKFNTWLPFSSALMGHRTTQFKSDPDIKYRNRRPKSIYVHMGKRIAMQTLEYEVHKLAQKWYENWTGGPQWQQRLKQNVERQKKNRLQLIDRQEVQRNNWGELRIVDAGHLVFAMDKYGNLVREAMILYYDNPLEKLTFTDFYNAYARTSEGVDFSRTQTITTKTWFHIDLAPQIDISSSKNVILTQVQGRDYTRKELVSGGDLAFSVSGNIVSNDEGVYPEEAVKKFVKMMQYNGIMNVKSFQFNQLGVTRVVIQDFRLGAPTYKNIQPYSFSCVAVEPDEDIVVVNDTIAQVNDMIEETVHTQSINLVNILKKKALELASENAIQQAGTQLDSLTSNI